MPQTTGTDRYSAEGIQRDIGGLAARVEGMEKSAERRERMMSEIASDLKTLTINVTSLAASVQTLVTSDGQTRRQIDELRTFKTKVYAWAGLIGFAAAVLTKALLDRFFQTI